MQSKQEMLALIKDFYNNLPLHNLKHVNEIDRLKIEKFLGALTTSILDTRTNVPQPHTIVEIMNKFETPDTEPLQSILIAIKQNPDLEKDFPSNNPNLTKELEKLWHDMPNDMIKLLSILIMIPYLDLLFTDKPVGQILTIMEEKFKITKLFIKLKGYDSFCIDTKFLQQIEATITKLKIIASIEASKNQKEVKKDEMLGKRYKREKSTMTWAEQYGTKPQNPGQSQYK